MQHCPYVQTCSLEGSNAQCTSAFVHISRSMGARDFKHLFSQAHICHSDLLFLPCTQAKQYWESMGQITVNTRTCIYSSSH